jgi:REP element-mobilizing transposase RayT
VADAKRVSDGSKVGRVIPNAPLRLPERQRLFHTPPPWVAAGEIFFITSCCADRKINQLARPEVFSVITAAVEHYVRAEKFWAHLFLAMPDHLHALVSFPREIQMEKVLRGWKRFVAKNAGVIWQAGFFDHRLRGEEGFEEKAHYIRMNPVRAGLVDKMAEWPYIWPALVHPAAR